MSSNNSWTGLATVITVVLVAAQAFLCYRVIQLDAADRYSEIPPLLGITVLLYAFILMIYMRVFIGAKAYKKPGTMMEGE